MSGAMEQNCNGRPDQVTSKVTPGRDGKATARTSISTRSTSMHATKSATVETYDRNNIEAMPNFLRPSPRRFFHDVRNELLEQTQHEVTLTQSVHIPASPPAWHESNQPISIDGQYNTGVCFPPGQSTKVEQTSKDQDPIRIRLMTSEAINTTTTTTPVNLYGHLKTKSEKSHASANVDNEIKSTKKLCNAQCVEQPETILEHRMRQPPQLGRKTYDFPPVDPPSLRSCQLENHTDALDATSNTSTLGTVGAWPRIRESKQEHPVIEQDKLSKDEQKKTPLLYLF